MKTIKLYTPEEKELPSDGRTLICIFNNHLGINAYTAEPLERKRRICWKIYPCEAGLFFHEDPEFWGDMQDLY